MSLSPRLASDPIGSQFVSIENPAKISQNDRIQLTFQSGAENEIFNNDEHALLSLKVKKDGEDEQDQGEYEGGRHDNCQKIQIQPKYLCEIKLTGKLFTENVYKSEQVHFPSWRLVGEEEKGQSNQKSRNDDICMAVEQKGTYSEFEKTNEELEDNQNLTLLRKEKESAHTPPFFHYRSNIGYKFSHCPSTPVETAPTSTFLKTVDPIKRPKYNKSITPSSQRRLPSRYRNAINKPTRKTIQSPSTKRLPDKRFGEEFWQTTITDKKLELYRYPFTFPLAKSVEELTKHFQQVENLQLSHLHSFPVLELISKQEENKMMHFDRAFNMKSRTKSPEGFMPSNISQSTSESSSHAPRMSFYHKREESSVSDDRSQRSQGSSPLFSQPELYRKIRIKRNKKTSDSANAWDEEEKPSKSSFKSTSKRKTLLFSNQPNQNGDSLETLSKLSSKMISDTRDAQPARGLEGRNPRPNLSHERSSSLQGNTFEICCAPIPVSKSNSQPFKGIDHGAKHSGNSDLKLYRTQSNDVDGSMKSLQGQPTPPQQIDNSRRRAHSPTINGSHQWSPADSAKKYAEESSPVRNRFAITSPRPYQGGGSQDLNLGSNSTPALLRDIDLHSTMQHRERAISKASSLLSSLSVETTDTATTLELARSHGLLSPISMIDSSNQAIAPKRVSKNINVQTFRGSEQEIQEALRDSDVDEEIKETEQKQRIGSNQDSQSDTSTTVALNTSITPQSLASVSTQSQNLDLTAQVKSDLDDINAASPATAHHNDHTGELKAYSTFLTELSADLAAPSLENIEKDNAIQIDNEKTVTYEKSVASPTNGSMKRSSSTQKQRASSQAQNRSSELPRSSYASLTSDQSMLYNHTVPSSKTSDTEITEEDKSEYSHSSGMRNTTSSDQLERNSDRGNEEDIETSSKAKFCIPDEEVLQSSMESSTCSSAYGQLADVANMEMLQCSIQSARRLEISAPASPLPRLLKSESQQSLVLNAKALQRSGVNGAKKKELGEENTSRSTESESSTAEEKKFPKLVSSEIQRMNIIPATSKEKLHISLSWASTLDLRRFKKITEDPSPSDRHGDNFQDIHGNLRLREEDVERIARAWINSQLCEDKTFTGTGDSSVEPGRGLQGFTEDELRKVDKIVLEERQREILTGKALHSVEDRNEIREKITSLRTSHDALLQCSPEKPPPRRRSLHLKPVINLSPVSPIDSTVGIVSDLNRCRSAGNSPCVQTQPINPFDVATHSIELNSKLSGKGAQKRYSPPKSLPYNGTSSTILLNLAQNESVQNQERIRAYQQSNPPFPASPDTNPTFPKSLKKDLNMSKTSITDDNVSTKSSETKSTKSMSKRSVSRQSSKKSKASSKAMLLFNGLYNG